MTINVDVNGKERALDVPEDTPLLYILRDELELNAAKFGCGLAQCGACTVLVDGQATRSCSMPVSAVEGAKVQTLEGLANPDGSLHALQNAFLAEQAAQCGYCMNGMIMTAAAFLNENKNPTEQEVREALDYNLCRCGSHNRIVRAVLRAAKELA